MVKSYLRYEPLAAFGVICSGKGNICYDKTGKAALVPALEQIILWDLKKGQEVNTTECHRSTFSRFLFTDSFAEDGSMERN